MAFEHKAPEEIEEENAFEHDKNHGVQAAVNSGLFDKTISWGGVDHGVADKGWVVPDNIHAVSAAATQHAHEAAYSLSHATALKEKQQQVFRSAQLTA